MSREQLLVAQSSLLTSKKVEAYHNSKNLMRLTCFYQEP